MHIQNNSRADTAASKTCLTSRAHLAQDRRSDSYTSGLLTSGKQRVNEATTRKVRRAREIGSNNDGCRDPILQGSNSRKRGQNPSTTDKYACKAAPGATWHPMTPAPPKLVAHGHHGRWCTATHRPYSQNPDAHGTFQVPWLPIPPPCLPKAPSCMHSPIRDLQI